MWEWFTHTTYHRGPDEIYSHTRLTLEVQMRAIPTHSFLFCPPDSTLDSALRLCCIPRSFSIVFTSSLTRPKGHPFSCTMQNADDPTSRPDWLKYSYYTTGSYLNNIKTKHSRLNVRATIQRLCCTGQNSTKQNKKQHNLQYMFLTHLWS